MNPCEIWLFHIVWGVSKGTRDNYHEIWWKQCFMSKIYRYIWILGGTRGMYIFHRTFFVYYSKNGKSAIAWPILKSNSTSFWFEIFFPRMNKKIIYEKRAQGGPTPISLQSEYSSSNWFHNNTPNSRHLFNANC